MRIVLVTVQLGMGYHYGTERYVEALGRSLEVSGHEVHYLAGDPLGRREPARVGEPVGWGGKLHSHPTWDWAAVLGGSRAGLVSWLRGLQPDLVHVANPAHIGAGMLAACDELGIPTVVTAMDFWWICPRATLLRRGSAPCHEAPGWLECTRCIAHDHPRPLLRRLAALPAPLAPIPWALMAAGSLRRGCSPADVLRWPRRRELLAGLLRSAGAVLFPSAATRDALAPLLPRNRWHLVPYGLEARWLRPAREIPAGPRPPEELRIGYAGALAPHKGVDLLLEALQRLDWRRTRVRVAGAAHDEAYQRRLEALAEGLQVEFTGLIEPGAMPDFLDSLDLLVVPSRWAENLPFALLEAHAAGLPAVGSRVAGIEGEVGDEKLLFEPGSAADLARSLGDFAAGRVRGRPPGVRSAEEMARETEAIYASLVEGRDAAAARTDPPPGA